MEILSLIIGTLVAILIVRSLIGKINGKRAYMSQYEMLKLELSKKPITKMDHVRKYVNLLEMVGTVLVKITFVVLIVIAIVSKIISWFK